MENSIGQDLAESTLPLKMALAPFVTEEISEEKAQLIITNNKPLAGNNLRTKCILAQFIHFNKRPEFLLVLTELLVDIVLETEERNSIALSEF